MKVYPINAQLDSETVAPQATKATVALIGLVLLPCTLRVFLFRRFSMDLLPGKQGQPGSTTFDPYTPVKLSPCNRLSSDHMHRLGSVHHARMVLSLHAPMGLLLGKQANSGIPSHNTRIVYNMGARWPSHSRTRVIKFSDTLCSGYYCFSERG